MWGIVWLGTLLGPEETGDRPLTSFLPFGGVRWKGVWVLPGVSGVAHRASAPSVW
jgi:hypothetical protein